MPPVTSTGRLRRWGFTAIDTVRAGAEAVGKGVDKVGDWSMRAGGAAVRNPGRTVAASTAILFVIADVPTVIFYTAFGVRPVDAGLNSVEVLLQSSAVVLILFAVASVVIAGLMLLTAIVLMAPHAILVGRLPRRGDKRSVGQSIARTFRRVGRLAPILIPVISVSFTVYYFGSYTYEAIDTIKSGQALEEAFVPWQVEPVVLLWKAKERPSPLPTSCRWLFYLGENDGRVVVYDAKHEDTYRINSKEVELVFPVFCSHPEHGQHGTTG